MAVSVPTASQRRNVRQLWTTFALVVLISALLAVAAATTPPAEPVPYDLDGSHPRGLLALRLWLEELGYDVQRTGGLTFAIPENAELLFVYPNRLSYTPTEAETLRAWVEAGHTLVVVGPDQDDGALEQAFGVRVAPEDGYVSEQVQVQPLTPEGQTVYPARWTLLVRTLTLDDAPQAVTVLASRDGRPTVAVQQVGEGVVWHLAPGNGLTNEGLQVGEQGDLLPAFLRTVPSDGAVVFDTYHLYGLSRVGERIVTLQDWLYRTPAGWATLFGLGVVGLYVVLQGRRLGPALVPARELRRREAAEFVEAMANLQRRAHLHAEVATHHRIRLKRGLAQRWPISPDLPDAEFYERLAEVQPPVPAPDLEAIHAVLTGLQAAPTPRALVHLTAKVDEILAR